jgi:hypothetical protein
MVKSAKQCMIDHPITLPTTARRVVVWLREKDEMPTHLDYSRHPSARRPTARAARWTSRTPW